MAREFAQIKLAIWADDDWRDLSPGARYLYLTLLTSPTLSHCGVADWRPARIGAINGMEAADVQAFGAELVAALYVVIDTESEEVMIRSFLRNDGLMKQPKMAVAMASAHAAVASVEIRGVVVHELKRLREDLPDLNGWGAERATALLSMRSVNPSDYPLGKGSIKGKPTPFGKGSSEGSPTPAPNSYSYNSSLSPVGDSSADAADAPNGGLTVVGQKRLDVERICEHLAQAIEDNGSKRPTIGQTWLDAARLMLDRDGLTEQEIRGAIDWSQGNEFWRANVMSMPKLREKFDQLRLQAQRKGRPSKQQETDDLFERAARRMGVTGGNA